MAEITGVNAGDIIELARAYASMRPAVIRTFVGMEHHANGAMTLRTISCLPALVGAWRDRGGGLLHFTESLFAEALNFDAVEMPELEDPAIRSVNMVQLGQALTDTSLNPLIRSLLVYNSNPVSSAPNQNLVLEGLRRVNLFTVVVEQFMTDTAAYADYVFPATTQVEHSDLLWSWGQTYLLLNLPAIDPVGEAAPNTEFFRRLAQRLGYTEPYLAESDENLIRAALTSDHPYLRGISFERLQDEGWAPLSLPPDWPCFANGNFPTPSGKCELYAESLIASEMDPLPAYVPLREIPNEGPKPAIHYPLSLLTPKSTLHFLNSCYANNPRHLKAEENPRLEMHPDDAAVRNIGDGDMVRIYNDLGIVEIRASVANRIRTGVVSIPSGWWASLCPGKASANALTVDGLSDLGGGGDFHDSFVEVERMA